MARAAPPSPSFRTTPAGGRFTHDGRFCVHQIINEAIRSPKVKSNIVLSVKDNLYNAKDLVSLVWVKAHAGNPGNELADNFAKIADGSICLYLLLILMQKEFIRNSL
ncbi:hypothetical protein AVEN_25485-1 [Araneus ventricosus]|uniref:RNase H type-1 domain-containing protein n=1 Tax=Araneus ventricosus TaxID=182803 RepID=A0A4Y2CSX0_ARAVE|nr:hypothetical protein AVEN_25485-1 [Araneus ventricosus]